MAYHHKVRRAEILVKVDAFSLVDTPYIDQELQETVKQKILQKILENSQLYIDSQLIEPKIEKVNFINSNSNLIIIRHETIKEKTDQAVIGIILSYKTSGIAETVDLQWKGILPNINLPVMIIDPEKVINQTLTNKQQQITWQNQLADNILPTITTIAVARRSIKIPLLSLLILISLLVIKFSYKPKFSNNHQFILLRLFIPAIIISYTVWQIKLPFFHFSYYQPTNQQASLILKKLLTNVYYALEFSTQEDIYDQLALSITGEYLATTYLGHLKSLDNNSVEGIKMKIEDLTIINLSQVKPQNQGFSAQVTWQVNGSINHFGHTHFRNNQYQAKIIIIADHSTWKIIEIDILDQL